MPLTLADHPIYRSARKLLMVRDPRDALVSEYFSNAYSHQIPARAPGGSDVNRLMTGLRLEAGAMQIDAWVLRGAGSMLRAFMGYAEEMRSGSTRVIRYEDYIFRKRELVRLMAEQFALTVSEAQIDEMMSWADVRPEKQDPAAFIRRVTPGDHREKLRAETIAALNSMLQPALDAFAYLPGA